MVNFYFFSALATNKAAATTASAMSAYMTTLLSDEASARLRKAGQAKARADAQILVKDQGLSEREWVRKKLSDI